MSGVRYPFASSTRLTAITISLLARLCGRAVYDRTLYRNARRVLVFTAGFPHYSETNLDLDPTEGRGHFLDGRAFLLAHLRAAEAKEAPLLGGLGDLLRHSNQPLLEPLGFIGFGLLVDEHGHLPHALDRITLDLIRRFAFQLCGRAQLPGSRLD